MHSPTFDDHRPLVASRRNCLKLIAGGLLSASGVLVACGGGADASSATTDTTSTGGTTGTGGTTTATTTTTFNALWIPPLLAGVTTAGVTTYELTLANSAVQYRSGAKTATRICTAPRKSSSLWGRAVSFWFRTMPKPRSTCPAPTARTTFRSSSPAAASPPPTAWPTSSRPPPPPMAT